MPVLRLYHRATDLSLKAGSALAANHPGVKVRGCVRLAWEYSVCVFACVRVVRVHTPCARDHMPLGARRRPLPRTPACALPPPCVPPLLQWPTHLVSRLCGQVNTPLCARLLVRARSGCGLSWSCLHHTWPGQRCEAQITRAVGANGMRSCTHACPPLAHVRLAHTASDYCTKTPSRMPSHELARETCIHTQGRNCLSHSTPLHTFPSHARVPLLATPYLVLPCSAVMPFVNCFGWPQCLSCVARWWPPRVMLS
jgi:hypothetical protein